MNELARIYREHEDYQQSAHYLSLAIAQNSKWAESTYLEEVRHKEPRSAFESQIKNHIEKQPGTTEAEDDSRFQKLVELLLQKEPDNQQLHYYKMRILLQTNQLAAAIECYNKKIAEKTLSANDYYELANAYLSEEKKEEACVCFYKAYLNSDENTQTHNDPEEILKTLHLLLREADAQAPKWNGDFAITAQDNQRLAAFILAHEA